VCVSPTRVGAYLRRVSEIVGTSRFSTWPQACIGGHAGRVRVQVMALLSPRRAVGNGHPGIEAGRLGRGSGRRRRRHPPPNNGCTPGRRSIRPRSRPAAAAPPCVPSLPPACRRSSRAVRRAAHVPDTLILERRKPASCKSLNAAQGVCLSVRAAGGAVSVAAAAGQLRRRRAPLHQPARQQAHGRL
jgi:hypothetical protein